MTKLVRWNSYHDAETGESIRARRCSEWEPALDEIHQEYLEGDYLVQRGITTELHDELSFFTRFGVLN